MSEYSLKGRQSINIDMTIRAKLRDIYAYITGYIISRKKFLGKFKITSICLSLYLARKNDLY